MGNIASSPSVGSFDAERDRLESTVAALKKKGVLSSEVVAKLEREVAAQKKTIALMKTATRDMMMDDRVCDRTKKELQAVVDENNTLVRDLKLANEKHQSELEALRDAKAKVVTELEAQQKRTEVNDRARASLEIKLVDLRKDHDDSVARAKALRITADASAKAVQRLERNRQALLRRINSLMVGLKKIDGLRQTQATAFAKEKQELRATRPYFFDRINNASETVSLFTESVRVSISNVDVKPPRAMGVIVVTFRGSDNSVRTATIRISGNGGINVHHPDTREIVASNLQRGQDATRVLTTLLDGFTIQVARTPILRNGWSFTLRPPPQGGVFTRLTAAVEGDNEWYGMTKLAISEAAPVTRDTIVARGIAVAKTPLQVAAAAATKGMAPAARFLKAGGRGRGKANPPSRTR